MLPDARRTASAPRCYTRLADMRSTLGYAYAVASHVGEPEFSRRAAGATDLPGSE